MKRTLAVVAVLIGLLAFTTLVETGMLLELAEKNYETEEVEPGSDAADALGGAS